ncbi:uncharacterized protein LOC144134793 [Amblyomma americanum]
MPDEEFQPLQRRRLGQGRRALLSKLYLFFGLAGILTVGCFLAAAYVKVHRGRAAQRYRGAPRVMVRDNGCRCVYVGRSMKSKPPYDQGGHICVCPAGGGAPKGTTKSKRPLQRSEKLPG